MPFSATVVVADSDTINISSASPRADSVSLSYFCQG
jgi:hypothetical protein